MPPVPLRNQRREVPLALERDPGALRPPLRHAVHILADHGATGEPHRPDRMLSLKLLAQLLRPLDRGSPRQDDLHALGNAVAVLDFDALFHHVRVAAESQGFPHLEPKAVLPCRD